MLHQLFPHGKFSRPATEAQIADVERQLGVVLPFQLRQLYLECDGFREDRGNAKYLLSLMEEDHVGSLLTMTRFWWNEWRGRLPKLGDYVFYGSSSGDESWGINWQSPENIIAYHHHMEDKYEIVGREIIDVYREDYSKYEQGR